MKCPDCLLEIHRTAEECPHCGMSLLDLRKTFSSMDPIVDDGVQDLAGVLRRKMRDSLIKAFEKAQRQFTNLQLAISFVDLPHTVKIQSYGFWILNDGVFRRQAKEIKNEGGRIVIVIDMTSKKATINAGYILDDYIAKGEVFDVLADGHASLLEGDLVKGGEEMFSSLRKYLRKLNRRAVKGKVMKK